MAAERPSGGGSSDPQPRIIGTAGGTAIVAGSMLGIGIFLTPPQVAGHLPSFALYILVWLAGGFIAFSGAVAYAELGTRFPEAGGDYVFLREAFGGPVSTAAGWLLFVGVFTGSVATMAVPLAEFQVPVLLAPIAEIDPSRTLWEAEFVEVTGARAIAVATIVGLTLINVWGTKLSTAAQIALTGIPIVALAAAAVWGMATTSPAATDVKGPAGSPGRVSFGRAVLAVYFSYAGWNAIAYVGGDHVRTQIPYAITCAGIAAAAGFIPAGYGAPPIVLLPLGIAAVVAVVLLLGRRLPAGSSGN